MVWHLEYCYIVAVQAIATYVIFYYQSSIITIFVLVKYSSFAINEAISSIIVVAMACDYCYYRQWHYNI